MDRGFRDILLDLGYGASYIFTSISISISLSKSISISISISISMVQECLVSMQ